jgi:hypothetical protein
MNYNDILPSNGLPSLVHFFGSIFMAQRVISVLPWVYKVVKLDRGFLDGIVLYTRAELEQGSDAEGVAYTCPMLSRHSPPALTRVLHRISSLTSTMSMINDYYV